MSSLAGSTAASSPPPEETRGDDDDDEPATVLSHSDASNDIRKCLYSHLQVNDETELLKADVCLAPLGRVLAC